MYNFLMAGAAIVLSVSIVLFVVTATITSRLEDKNVPGTLAFTGQLAIFWISASITGMMCLICIEALSPVVDNENGGILTNLAQSAYIILGYFGLAFVLVGGFVGLDASKDLARTIMRRKANNRDA